MVVKPFGTLQWLIAALTIATALIHLVLGVAGVVQSSFTDTLAILFVLNGLGYLGLWAAGYLNVPALAPYRAQARLALLAFALVTFALYFAFNETRDALGLITKAIELGVVVGVFVERRGMLM